MNYNNKSNGENVYLEFIYYLTHDSISTSYIKEIKGNMTHNL